MSFARQRGLDMKASEESAIHIAELVGKVKEFIYLLEDLTPEQVKGLGMEELKAFHPET